MVSFNIDNKHKYWIETALQHLRYAVNLIPDVELNKELNQKIDEIYDILNRHSIKE